MQQEKKIITVPNQASLEQVTEEIHDFLMDAGVPMKTANRMNVALDEVYSNVVYYSGADRAELMCRVEDGAVRLTVRDNGTPFDPLAKDDPNVTASAEERSIGGLGIFMTKKLMTSVEYRLEGGENCTEMVLKF